MDLAVGKLQHKEKAFSTLAALEFHSTHAALSSPSLLLVGIDCISFSTRKPYTLVNNAFGSRHFLS